MSQERLETYPQHSQGSDGAQSLLRPEETEDYSKDILQQRFLQATNGAVGRNYEESRKTPGDKEYMRIKLGRKYGRAPKVVADAISQDLDSDSDFSSGPSAYVPPEDPEMLAKFAKPEIDLPGVARITRELPDPLGPHASLIGSATEDPEIARIFIEGQNRGIHNGPGPSRLKMFSLNPRHLSEVPDEDDYGPDSRP